MTCHSFASTTGPASPPSVLAPTTLHLRAVSPRLRVDSLRLRRDNFHLRAVSLRLRVVTLRLRTDHIDARSRLNTTANDCRDLVRVLDGLNKARFARTPERLEGWESASNVYGPINRSDDDEPETPVTDTTEGGNTTRDEAAA